MLAHIALPARRSRSTAAVRSLAEMFSTLQSSLLVIAFPAPSDNISNTNIRPPLADLFFLRLRLFRFFNPVSLLILPYFFGVFLCPFPLVLPAGCCCFLTHVLCLLRFLCYIMTSCTYCVLFLFVIITYIQFSYYCFQLLLLKKQGKNKKAGRPVWLPRFELWFHCVHGLQCFLQGLFYALVSVQLAFQLPPQLLVVCGLHRVQPCRSCGCVVR